MMSEKLETIQDINIDLDIYTVFSECFELLN